METLHKGHIGPANVSTVERLSTVHSAFKGVLCREEISIVSFIWSVNRDYIVIDFCEDLSMQPVFCFIFCYFAPLISISFE